MISRQETYDAVVDHLRKQGCKSMVPHLGNQLPAQCCRYRGPGGTKCAAGALIPDDKYSPEMEGESLFVPPMEDELGLAGRVLKELGHDLDLLSQLQYVHDNWPVAQWESRFQGLAKSCKLKYSPRESDAQRSGDGK